MRKLHFISSVLIVFVLLTALVGTAGAAPPAPRAKWTVMVYISGDNDLDYYVVPDIELELAKLGSTADVQVVALADRGPRNGTSSGDWQGTLLFHVEKDLKALPENAEEDWGEKNMADPQTLIDFVTWTRINYPADHYALYFWGHGWNWQPGYLMQDDTSNDTLDMHELENALPSIGFIDMVGFDGCNMASFEVQMLWHGHATALTHSQEWVGGEGVQYDLVLAQLASTPGMSADQLAITTSQTATGDKTWSAVAVDDRFVALRDAVDAWSIELKNGLSANRAKYDRAFSATRSFSQAPMDKDLYDMAYEINRQVATKSIRDASKLVMAAFDDVVLHERHVKTYADAHGITIYQISRFAQQDANFPYYQGRDFSSYTGWDEFIAAYAR
jgi:hypothetical protein